MIDCDKVAKEVREIPACIDALSKAFGRDIVKDGGIDKALLAQKAFDSRESLQKLTDVTHPFIIREILDRTEAAFGRGERLVFVDGAVIIGHDFEQYCHKFIVVVISEEKQIARLMSRDSLTREQAKNRFLKQTTYSDMLKKADYVINNNTDIQSLIVQGEFVLQQLEK